MGEFNCEFCKKEHNVLYEGWFYTEAKFHPYAAGTASAGLIQLRKACYDCTQEAIASGVACAKEIPGGS